MWKFWKPKPKPRVRTEKSAVEPLGQLELLSAEVNRELESISARQANAVTRSSIVLAAAGVSIFASGTETLWIALIPTLLSLSSALLSLEAIRYWKSEEVQLTRSLAKRYFDAPSDAVAWRILDDKFDELAAARSDLKRKTGLLVGATYTLILAWVSVVAIRFVVTPLTTGAGY